MLNLEEIKSIIPHRYPFLLIDRIEEYEEGKWARGTKNVTANEPFFQGHFPEKAVMPGVLMVEALAQVGAVTILTVPENKGKLVLFGGMDKVKFRRQVVPGDVLTLEVNITKLKGPVGKGEGICTVAGEKAVSCELTFALQEG